MKKSDRIEKYRQMITGVTANAGTTGIIPVKGVATAKGDIVSTLQAAIDAPVATAAAEATFHGAVALEQAANAKANAVCIGVKDWALVQFGNQPTVLAQFGLEAPKPRKPSVATKAAAAAKQRATRARLGTKGKKQKAAALAEAPASAEAPAVTAPTKGS
jgi:hypothetical protein